MWVLGDLVRGSIRVWWFRGNMGRGVRLGVKLVVGFGGLMKVDLV